MIINDLNYLEIATEEVVGGWGYTPGFSYEKELDIEVETEIKFDTEIDFKKNYNADIKIDSDADIKGNIATLTFDVEAIGKDTLAEVDVAVLAVENKLSSVTGSMISAVN
ncbi:hypothetical protein WJM97_04820 [Okeanomitos corallinicola TIOX110]|uniref:Uncharacterized protein n=1 Tax=Okeanomitos corallinicola TIOX110 TaxID=3133117 RepID=A0ABZ2UZL1_9CYAN